ncbi:hypothetical protein OIO90_005354 [Microbotryomycetes sp. JL221]|nr:hypothetical protein OIO90_005354 [Microbotryomycetes sp. JL221]
MYRTLLTSTSRPAARYFSTTVNRGNNSATDAVKQAAEKVHRVASDAALKGVEAGEAATESVKKAAEPIVGKAKDAASDAQTQASKTGSDLKASAEKAKADAQNAANKATR